MKIKQKLWKILFVAFLFTQRVQIVLQVAEIIKEDLWPNPLKYFNNVIFYIILDF